MDGRAFSSMVVAIKAVEVAYMLQAAAWTNSDAMS
jgi:hypothetical protein